MHLSFKNTLRYNKNYDNNARHKHLQVFQQPGSKTKSDAPTGADTATVNTAPIGADRSGTSLYSKYA